MCVTPPRSTHWPGARPCAIVLAVSCIFIAAIGVPAYMLGKNWEDERRFLTNYRAPSFMEAEIVSHLHYAMNSDEDNQVVFVGGSTCEMAVDPRLFQQATGLTAYNLGTDGHIRLAGHLEILKRYLQHHPAPRAVVLCNDPVELQGEFLRNIEGNELRERFMWCYGPPDAPRPHHASGPRDYCTAGVRIAFGRLMGGLDYYRDVRQPSRDASTYREMSFSDWDRVLTDGRGFLEMQYQGEYRTDRLQHLPDVVSPEHLADLHELAKLTAARGIRLIVRPTPVIKFRAPLKPDGFERPLAEFARQWSHVVIGRPLIVVMDADQFYEGSHLDRAGATAFTRLVAAEVQAALAEK